MDSGGGRTQHSYRTADRQPDRIGLQAGPEEPEIKTYHTCQGDVSQPTSNQFCDGLCGGRCGAAGSQRVPGHEKQTGQRQEEPHGTRDHDVEKKLPVLLWKSTAVASDFAVQAEPQHTVDGGEDRSDLNDGNQPLHQCGIAAHCE